MLGAITAILGGFVLSGSNGSTMQQTQEPRSTSRGARSAHRSAGSNGLTLAGLLIDGALSSPSIQDVIMTQDPRR